MLNLELYRNTFALRPGLPSPIFLYRQVLCLLALSLQGHCFWHVVGIQEICMDRRERERWLMSQLFFRAFAYNSLPGPWNKKILTGGKAGLRRLERSDVSSSTKGSADGWGSAEASFRCFLGYVTCHPSGSVIGGENRALLTSKGNKSGKFVMLQ